MPPDTTGPVAPARRTLIKLCGFIDTRDVEVALQLDVEAIGIVLARDARTPLTPTAIEELLEVTRGGDVVRVAVVGPMTRDECLRIAELGFDALQWVVPPNADDESGLLEIGTLGDAPVVPVFFDTEDVEQRIKATPLPYLTGEAIERTLCLDGPRGGGKGVPPSWERASRIAKDVPLMLAGGLNPANVREALVQVRPRAVDVSSGIEGADGRKCPETMARFVAAVRDVC